MLAPPAASTEGTEGRTQTSDGDSKCRPPPLRLPILPQPGRRHLGMGSNSVSSWRLGVVPITQDVCHLHFCHSPGTLSEGHPTGAPTLPKCWLSKAKQTSDMLAMW